MKVLDRRSKGEVSNRQTKSLQIVRGRNLKVITKGNIFTKEQETLYKPVLKVKKVNGKYRFTSKCRHGAEMLRWYSGKLVPH